MCVFTLITSPAAVQARAPNFVVIMADDLGAGELGAYGHPSHQTPNLDRLGREGVQFDTCLTAPVCHPTRFTIMTGQYGFRTGVLNFAGKRAGPPRGDDGPDNIANHLTFAQLLKPAGYATALAGKWQLSGTPPTLIHETGFDDQVPDEDAIVRATVIGNHITSVRAEQKGARRDRLRAVFEGGGRSSTIRRIGKLTENLVGPSGRMPHP